MVDPPGSDPGFLKVRDLPPQLMNVFQLGKFTLHSGEVAEFKIDCDFFTDEDMVCFAHLLSHRLPQFGSVEGVPTGGLRLARAMSPYQSRGPLLIVDDVLTTGHSMEEHRGPRAALGAVIFSRSNDWPSWIVPLFVMSPWRG